MITLKKSIGKDFVILNLTDPQLVTQEWEDKGEGEKILVDTVDILVKRTKPDLITVSGDISAAEYPEAYKYFADLIDKYNVPWTVTNGNHDNQGGNEAVQEYIKLFKTYKSFIFEDCDSTLGNSNFTIAIDDDGKIVHGIIMMDTHDRVLAKDEFGKDTWYWGQLYPCQLAWYENEVKTLQSFGCNNTSIIAHIPIYAYRKAFGAAFKHEKYDPKQVTYEQSLNGDCWNDGYKDSFGVNHEGICSYIADDGMMDLIEKLGSTKLFLCGHDHVNCSCIKYRGTKLMYSLKTGKGCYWEKGMSGGTTLSIDSCGNITPKHEFVD